MDISYKSFEPYDLNIPDRQRVLTSAVAPRPIAFASTVDKQGNVNLSPFSFFNVFSNNPPVLIFSPARRGRDNTTKHTYENIKEVSEVCISVVNYPMVEQMSLASTEYDKGVNEFEKSGFTQIECDLIKPPRVGESPVSFECTVDQIIELGNEGGAGNLVLARIKKIHLHPDYLDEDGFPDTVKLDMVGRMGESWYSRANKPALFEIPKPLRNKGIGVDALPDSIRNSTVLTGNNLGRLGNLEQFPSDEELKEVRVDERIVELFKITETEELRTKLHQLAQKELELGDPMKAFAILMVSEHEH